MATLEEYSIPVEWDSSFSVNVEPDYQVYTPDAELAEDVVLQEVTLGVSALDLKITMPLGMDTRAISTPVDETGNPVDLTGYSAQVTDNGDGTQTCQIHMSFTSLEGTSLTFQVIQQTDANESTEVLGSYTLNLGE